MIEEPSADFQPPEEFIGMTQPRGGRVKTLRVYYEHRPINPECRTKKYYHIDVPELENGLCQTPSFICMVCQVEARIVRMELVETKPVSRIESPEEVEESKKYFPWIGSDEVRVGLLREMKAKVEEFSKEHPNLENFLPVMHPADHEEIFKNGGDE